MGPVVPPTAQRAGRQAKEVGGIGPLPTGGLQVATGFHDVPTRGLLVRAFQTLPGGASTRRCMSNRLGAQAIAKVGHDFGFPRCRRRRGGVGFFFALAPTPGKGAATPPRIGAHSSPAWSWATSSPKR